MTAQDGAGVMCVEHAGDRDAVAGISRAWVGVLSGPTCRACPFLPRRLLNARLQARVRWPFRRGRADVRLDDGER